LDILAPREYKLRAERHKQPPGYRFNAAARAPTRQFRVQLMQRSAVDPEPDESHGHVKACQEQRNSQHLIIGRYVLLQKGQVEQRNFWIQYIR